MKNILIVTDFSEYSNKALINVSKIAAAFQSKIIIFHKYEISDGYSTKTESLNELPTDIFYGKLAYKKIEEQVDNCNLDIDSVEIIISHDKYKKEIKRIIKNFSVDLIVFGYKIDENYFTKFKLSKPIRKIIKYVNIPIMLVSEISNNFSLDRLVYLSNTNDEDFYNFSKLLLFSNKIGSNLNFIKIDNSLIRVKDENRVDLMESLCDVNNLKLNTNVISESKAVTYGVSNKCLNDLIKLEEGTLDNLIVF